MKSEEKRKAHVEVTARVDFAPIPVTWEQQKLVVPVSLLFFFLFSFHLFCGISLAPVATSTEIMHHPRETESHALVILRQPEPFKTNKIGGKNTRASTFRHHHSCCSFFPCSEPNCQGGFSPFVLKTMCCLPR